jgi:hypothetical protein
LTDIVIMKPARAILTVLLLASAAVAAQLDVAILSGRQGAVSAPPGTRIQVAVLGHLRGIPGGYLVSTAVEFELVEGMVTGEDSAESQADPIPVSSILPVPPGDGLRGPVLLAAGSLVTPQREGVYRLRLGRFSAFAVDGSRPGMFSQATAPVRPGRLDDLWIQVAGEAPALVDSSPPGNAIDARQPWNPDGTDVAGWSTFELTFVGDTSSLSPEDFQVTHSLAGAAPQVTAVRADGPYVSVSLSDIIELSAWTQVTHIPSGTSFRVGYLPGDVDGDSKASSTDVLALMDHLSGRHSRPPFQTDVERNGRTDADDLSRLIELLSGSEGYPAFLGTTLPE